MDFDEIWIAGAVNGKVYKPDGADLGNRMLSFEIPAGTAVYSGFEGNEQDVDDRDPFTYLTILSGDLNAILWYRYAVVEIGCVKPNDDAQVAGYPCSRSCRHP